MKRIALALVALFPLVSGCVSTTTVTKVEDPDKSGVHGFRYSLPATMLLVQPKPDGSASYTWVYPADRSKTYAVRQRSFLSKFTQSYTVTNGLLTKVGDKHDDTAVAAKLSDAAQTTLVARETSRKTEQKATATKVAVASSAYRTAVLARQQAESELKLLQAGDPPTPAALLAANMKLENAELAEAAAKKALTDANSETAADVPSSTGPAAFKQFGPMLFNLTFVGDVPQLKAVKGQDEYDTVGPATTSVAPPGKVKVTLTSAATVAANKTFVMTFTVDPPGVVDAGTTTITNSKNLPLRLAQSGLVAAPATAAKTFTLTFPNGLSADTYTITPALKPDAGGTPNAANPITLKIVP